MTGLLLLAKQRLSTPITGIGGVRVLGAQPCTKTWPFSKRRWFSTSDCWNEEGRRLGMLNRRHKRLVRRLGLHLAALRHREHVYGDEFSYVETGAFYTALGVIARAVARDDEDKAEQFMLAVEIEARS